MSCRSGSGSRPTSCRALLFTEAGNLLPFEVIGVLLLAAVIGGVFLAKREPGGPP